MKTEKRKIRIKKINFPEEEIQTLSKQKIIITHRVSDDAERFDVGDIVIVPWNYKYRVTGKKVIVNVDESPFAKFLTKEQRDFLSRYDKIVVLRLEKIDE